MCGLDLGHSLLFTSDCVINVAKRNVCEIKAIIFVW